MFHLSQQASVAAAFGAGVFNGVVIMTALVIAAFLVAPLFSGVLVVAVIPIVIALRPITRQARRRASQNIAETVGLSEQIAATSSLAFTCRRSVSPSANSNSSTNRTGGRCG